MGLSGDQVPMGMEPRGCERSGSDANDARKWRMRHASTPEMVAMCSTCGMSSPPEGSHERIGATLHRDSTSVLTTCGRAGGR